MLLRALCLAKETAAVLGDPTMCPPNRIIFYSDQLMYHFKLEWLLLDKINQVSPSVDCALSTGQRSVALNCSFMAPSQEVQLEPYACSTPSLHLWMATSVESFAH